MFIHDNQAIRSFCAQDLKKLLGIEGPVPAEHLARHKELYPDVTVG